MAYQGLGYMLAGVMPQARATGLFVSLCTLQQPDGILIGAGQPSGVYTDVTGLVDIPCMAAPTGDSRITSSEEKTLDDTQVFSPMHVLLDDYYPSISQGVVDGWRAVIDDVNYDLLGSENDSQAKMTRLIVRMSGV